MLFVFRFVPLIVLAACAAGSDDSTGASSPTSATGREEKVVCGMEEPTGSRLRVKRCWTQEQRDQEERDSEALIRRSEVLRPAPADPRAR